jgi:hypothetical protein
MDIVRYSLTSRFNSSFAYELTPLKGIVVEIHHTINEICSDENYLEKE